MCHDYDYEKPNINYINNKIEEAKAIKKFRKIGVSDERISELMGIPINMLNIAQNYKGGWSGPVIIFIAE